MSRLLLAAYLVEAGFLLTVAPWTLFWERNYFAQLLPWLEAAMGSAYVRGAVTGIGLVTIVVGVRDLSNTILARGGGANSHTER